MFGFRIQRTSRCPEFTAVLSISYCVFFNNPPPPPPPPPPHPHEVEGGTLVSHQKVCSVLSFVTNSKIWIFGSFFKFLPFTLSCVHVMWMLIPHPSFYCSNFKFSMMILLDLLNISSGFGPNCNFVFLAFFSTVTFHLFSVVASKIKLIPFYCSHFEWPEIWHADVSWSPWELIRFWSSSVDFPHFGGIFT